MSSLDVSQQVDVSQTGPGADPEAGALVIEPNSQRSWRVLGELWSHRDLLLLLAFRDVRIRYKQTVLGASWAVFQPLVTMVVLQIFFGHLMGMSKRVGDVPYPVFLYAGLLPWQLFAAATNASSGSLVGNANILTKVYFPRLIIPLSSLGAPLVDYAISFVILIGMMVWYGLAVSWSILLLPALILSTVLAVLGVGLLLSAVTVTYRDFRHVIPFMIQTLFFMTPVIYPSTIVPDRYRWVLSLNPMSGTIDAFRSVILNQPVDYSAWGISVAVALIATTVGLIYFQRAQKQFADVV